MGVFKDQLAKDIEAITGVNPKPLMDLGIMSLDEARKWVVKQKYYLLAKTGRTYADIKYDLSLEYGMSVSSIEKMIYRK
jgi:hypothetical protein